MEQKNLEVQRKLDKLANRYRAVKKFKPEALLEGIIGAMDSIGGMTGFYVSSGNTMTIHNHSASYNLPIRYEEHRDALSSFGKKAYGFLELLYNHMIDKNGDGAKRSIEFHLGKDYSSKHHDPFK